jgi:hypothetical protein
MIVIELSKYFCIITWIQGSLTSLMLKIYYLCESYALSLFIFV